jgi:antitoxin component YwqK of YwqJK toxin-antitoxin module|tara:strand:+ start:59 stop:670 length:612 start_codon:yes stop_codon:yes gene_type:complete
MKLYLIAFTIIFFASCDSQTKKQTDENKLKSTLLLKDTINTVSTPINSIDTLSNIDTTLRNGYFLEKKGMVRDGYYVNGKKEGIFRTYYNKEKGKVMSTYLYQSDTVVWSAHPAANKNRLIHIKNIHTSNDSTLVIVPFLNGKTWYEGVFNFNEPIGIHKTYFENSRLKGEVNYNNQTVTEFDSTGKVLFEGSINNYWNYLQK